MNWKKTLSVVSIIGSVASVIALIYIFYPANNKPIKLELTLESSDNLTMLNNVSEPEIKAKFEYKGTEILKLWRLNIGLRNISTKTIIGSGQLKNITSDNLIFYIDTGFQVIDKKMIKSDFNNTLNIIGLDTIHISFGQWRSNEQLRYALYLKTANDKTPNLEIFHQPLDRQIIDGDLVFSDKEDVKQKETFSDFLSPAMKLYVYIVSAIFYLTLIGIFIVILVSNPVNFYRRKVWLKSYYVPFVDFVNKNYHDHIDCDIYQKSPKEFKEWDKFNGKPYPADWGLAFTYKKTSSFIIDEMFFLIYILFQTIVFIDFIQIIVRLFKNFRM